MKAEDEKDLGNKIATLTIKAWDNEITDMEFRKEIKKLAKEYKMTVDRLVHWVGDNGVSYGLVKSSDTNYSLGITHMPINALD